MPSNANQTTTADQSAKTKLALGILPPSILTKSQKKTYGPRPITKDDIGDVIARCNPNTPHSIALENARLIAAAPDLIAACELHLRAVAEGGISGFDYATQAHNAIRAAVEKAKGGAR